MSTIEQLAEQINGREYRNEINREEEEQAKESGLVVLFGASDDLIELRGAINDEVCLYDGGEFFIDREGIVPAWENIDHSNIEEARAFFARESDMRVTVDARWDYEDYSWFISVNARPFAVFDIMEDGEKYCRGCVFKLIGA